MSCLGGYKDTYDLKVEGEVDTKPFGVINLDLSLIFKKFHFK
ncbi:hypothetical protein [Bacillus sp. AFS076308]|nr:hypothetical protein [Bacillus sp. AFS076308]